MQQFYISESYYSTKGSKRPLMERKTGHSRFTCGRHVPYIKVLYVKSNYVCKEVSRKASPAHSNDSHPVDDSIFGAKRTFLGDQAQRPEHIRYTRSKKRIFPRIRPKGRSTSGTRPITWLFSWRENSKPVHVRSTSIFSASKTVHVRYTSSFGSLPVLVRQTTPFLTCTGRGSASSTSSGCNSDCV